jgi:phospholipid/cholesterol/gamma-HCH transport system substrate-binding protein
MIRIAIKFGIFVVICLFFTGYLAFTIGNLKVSDPLGRNTYHVTALFDDVTGLIPDDNVKVAGVVVGKVLTVSAKHGRALVEFEIDNDHADLPRDTKAAIRWRNLIGQRYLYLYPGQSPQALQDNDVISSTASAVDLGELFNKLGPIVGAIDPSQVNKLLETLTQALDGRQDKVGQALDDLAVLAKGLGSRDQAIQRLITNLDTVAATINRRDAQIDTMLQNLITLSDAFGDNTATLDAAVKEFGKFSTDLDHVLSNNTTQIDGLLTHLAQLTATVHEKLPQLDEFLAGFAETNAAVARAGNRGEFLNQKILCAFIGPPSSAEGGCPTGDPITGLSAGAPAVRETRTGTAAITSIVEKVARG